MGLDSYDDMMGLDFGEFDGIGDTLMQGGKLALAGGAGILAASWGLQQIGGLGPVNSLFPSDPSMRSYAMGGLAILLGIGAGYAINRYTPHQELATAVTGAIAGVGLAAIAAQALGITALGKPLGMLPEDMALGTSPDAALLAQYDQYAMNGLGAASVVGSTGVATSAPAFGLAGPTVTPERLQGLDSTVTQMQTLGAYSPYMA
jgi:hypothetical protein